MIRGVRARLTVTIVALVVLTAAVLGIAALSLVIQRQYKRLLAYSSIEHTGLMCIGLALGPLSIDVAGRSVTRDGVDIPLTRTEFDLLLELVRHHGQVLTRDVLLDRVWGYDYLGDSRLVDVAIQRLRAKIETDPAAPELVLTVRGAGYKAAR